MSKRVSVIDSFRKLMGVCAATLAANAVQLDAASSNDAYIESHGTGSICLGHFAGPNTKIEVDFELKELLSQVRLFGNVGDHTTIPMFEVYLGSLGATDPRLRFSWEYSAADKTRQAWNMDVAKIGERRTIAFDAETRTYTSTPHGEGLPYSYTFEKAFLNATSVRPLAVFGACQNSYAASTNDFTVTTWPVKMKCYGVRIYESGTLVKNFIPCVKGGIAGLKETINDRFMCGVNAKDVGYGGDILVEKDDPYVSTAVNTNSLYLSNTGLLGSSIYFLTGYYMKTTTRLELDYALLTPDWSPDKLHGSMLNLISAGSSGKKMYVDVYGSVATRGNHYISLNGSDSAPNLRIETACDIRRTVTVTSNTYAFVTAGYTNVSWTTSGGIKEDQSSYSVKIACNQNGNTGFAPMKIYGLKIYESDELIKDFRPFVTNGVPGLIDILHPSDQHFCTTYTDSTVKTNRMAEAGGDFERDGCTASAEREAYLEFPGYGNGIDTGYKVPHNATIEADFALWLAKSNDSQTFISQGASPYIVLSWTAGAYWWKFADTSGNTDGFIPAVTTERLQYRLDSNAITIKCGEATPAARTKNWTSTATSGTATLKIGSKNAAMRLYRFKVLEGGTPVRDYVPCVTNGVAGLYELHTKAFFPLPGGKVCGRGYGGQSGEFEAVPQPIRIGHDETGVLSCLATSAQSYEWYEDGILVEGETGDSLTLAWERTKAKADKHTYIYSVVPVYTVFNETERGEAATAQVEFTPLGTSITIR